MKFNNALHENSRFDDSYRNSKVRDDVSSWAMASKKIDPMNPDYKEKFKGVEYDYKGPKDDPAFWKHYKKYFFPKDSQNDLQ